jgi:hypothetical protein
MNFYYLLFFVADAVKDDAANKGLIIELYLVALGTPKGW